MITKPITRRQTFEIQAGADALLTPGGGGIAVWVRRDELEPRAAVRFSTAAGKVGVYRFVGQDGEPIERDIERARAWCKGQEVA